MKEQVFNREVATQAAQESIDQVLSPEERRKRILRIANVAKTLSRQHGWITTDEIYKAYWDRGIDLSTWLGNPKSLTGVFTGPHWEAGTYRPSIMKTCHGRPKRTWRYNDN